jgi:hypothetical protein
MMREGRPCDIILGARHPIRHVRAAPWRICADCGNSVYVAKDDITKGAPPGPEIAQVT